MEYKLIVAVREDLELSKGKMAVQVAHASVSSSLNCKRKIPKWFKAWLEEGQKKVVVKAADLEELLELKKKAESKGLPFALVEDAGLTELPPGTTTCLGIGPAPNSVVDEITGHLKLW